VSQQLDCYRSWLLSAYYKTFLKLVLIVFSLCQQLCSPALCQKIEICGYLRRLPRAEWLQKLSLYALLSSQISNYQICIDLAYKMQANICSAAKICLDSVCTFLQQRYCLIVCLFYASKKLSFKEGKPFLSFIALEL